MLESSEVTANLSYTPWILPQRRSKAFPRTDIAVEAPNTLDNVVDFGAEDGVKQAVDMQQLGDALWREEEIVDALANGRLPQELTLRIFAEVVKRRCATVELSSAQSLDSYLAMLLSRSPSAARLRHLATQALLETANVRTRITFDRKEPFVHIPDFIATLPRRIWHLEIHCDVEIRADRRTYPINLFRMTRGIGGLSAHFPHLRTLVLVLDLDVSEDYGERVLDRECFCGFSAITTFRRAVVELLDAGRSHGPGLSKVFTMNWLDRNHRHYVGPEIILPAPSTLSEADSSETLLRASSKGTIV